MKVPFFYSAIMEDQKFCQEPAVNLKCVVFSLTLGAFYWFSQPKNKWFLLAALYLPYIAMAWYDFYYDCRKNPLRPTYLALFYYWIKPGESDQIQQFSKWCNRIKTKVLVIDLVVLIATLYTFIYIL